MRITTGNAIASPKSCAAVNGARNAIDNRELDRLPIGLAKEDR
jgi:hypothetical protein